MGHLRDHPDHLGGVGYLHKTVGLQDDIGFFGIGRAVVVPRGATEYGSDGNVYTRCDNATWGVYGFHTWDEVAGVCNCGSTEPPEPVMGHHILRMENLRFVQVVLDVVPHGYIVYMETFDPATEEQACRMRHSDCARTLQEVFRLMVEWDAAYTHFNNREQIAVTCHEMLAALNVPDAILGWLTDSIPPQKVELFLMGEPDAQDRRPGTPDLTDAFNEWVTELIIHSPQLGGRRA